MSTPRILIIAGSDSSGGAGIQADIKTVTMLGGHAMTAITAVTAQNSRGVSGVHQIPTQMVLDQIEACVSDIGVDAIKIGMIGSAETAMAVAQRLAELFQNSDTGPVNSDSGVVSANIVDSDNRMVSIPIVFDPVMIASSGAVLADAGTIAAFKRLMTIAVVTTPNLPELEALGGEAAVLGHGTALLIKGGHAAGESITDRLIARDGRKASWSDARIDTPHDHGTGCTLGSAIAMGLAKGMRLEDAITWARAFVHAALRAAPDFVSDNGPMGHQAVRVNEL